jgi:hypothetical protein
VRANPHTLLPRYCGAFSVASKDGGDVSFLVMSNTYFGRRDIDTRYDLKVGRGVGVLTEGEGSRVGRSVLDAKRRHYPDEVILKDNDLKHTFSVGARRREVILSILTEDCRVC